LGLDNNELQTYLFYLAMMDKNQANLLVGVNVIKTIFFFIMKIFLIKKNFLERYHKCQAMNNIFLF